MQFYVSSKLYKFYKLELRIIKICYLIITNFFRQWLPGEKLEKLGVSQEVDEAKLIESRKPADRKAVKRAYQEALLHRKQTHNSALDSTLNT
jgi:hypothetical protein